MVESLQVGWPLSTEGLRRNIKTYKTLCQKDAEAISILFAEEPHSKLVTLLRRPSRLQQKWKEKGVVPILGKILTDLLVLHVTSESFLEDDGFRNDKEKENHFLCEIELLQARAEKCVLEPVESSRACFQTMERLDMEARYALS